jgi:hypothetical protein
MPFGKKKLLAAFLEKDNLKFLAYEGKSRVFAGQISFAPEVVRDGFIADSAKFGSQIKIAFAQKEALRDANDVLLFVPSDKTFTKTLAASDSVDTFVHGLPYFQEELIITTKQKADKVAYVGFEKKLVEDFQRPFLESGKKVVAVESGASLLAARFAQPGRYLLLVPLDKEVVVIAAHDGEILDLAAFRHDVLVARLGEFLSSHGFAEVHRAATVGIFPKALTDKLRSADGGGLEIIPLEVTDIYDLMVTSALVPKGRPKLNLNPRYLFLAGAILAGSLLAFGVISKINSPPAPKPEVATPVAPEPAPVPVAPEPKPADFPVAVLNGTLVAGEAGRLAEKLKSLGFPVTETKNATSAGFVATRLRTTPTVPDKIVAELKTELLTAYESVVVEPQTASAGPALIEIVIGRKRTP